MYSALAEACTDIIGRKWEEGKNRRGSRQYEKEGEKMTEEKKKAVKEITEGLMQLDEMSLELIKFGTNLLKARDTAEGYDANKEARPA